MVCYVGHVVLLFVAVGNTLAMSTCDKTVGDTFLKGEDLKGSNLEDLATNYYWAALGVEPDKSGLSSIYLEFSNITYNAQKEKYLILSIKRTSTDMSSVTINTTWTQHGSEKVFDAKYPDGQYNIYHFNYKELIVFHRCSVLPIKDGNVSFTVFASICKSPEQVKATLEELVKVLKGKFPGAKQILLNYYVRNSTTRSLKCYH